MCLKGIDQMANSEDPDQTAPKGQFDLGLHYLLKSLCSKYLFEFLFNELSTFVALFCVISHRSRFNRVSRKFHFRRKLP